MSNYKKENDTGWAESFDFGKSYYDNERFDIITTGLRRVLIDLYEEGSLLRRPEKIKMGTIIDEKERERIEVEFTFAKRG